MGENSKIEWTDHTFNPWVGCTKISPACDGCYAEAWAKRTGHPELWTGERRRTTAANWKEPLKWNAKAAAAGVRYRVFCSSLADVFDNQVPQAWRTDLFHLIWSTPSLDWLLLTKRPQNIKKMLLPSIGEAELWPWRNVWLGTTAEDQEHYDERWAHLREIPARIRFISYEPALGPMLPGLDRHEGMAPDWIIAGGESGPKARAPHPQWFRDLRDDCEKLGIAYLFKQWGEWAPSTPEAALGNPRSGWRSIKGYPHVARAEELYPGAGAEFVEHVGKKAAGRLLDGREHNDLPVAA
jgi:protein gp37